MGTMIQGFRLSGGRLSRRTLCRLPNQIKGNNDVLNITQPDILRNIHRQYLDAGADIFSTNTFNANAISMEDYGMQEFAREMNLAAGRLTRTLADEYMAEHPDRTVFVAGSLGRRTRRPR